MDTYWTTQLMTLMKIKEKMRTSTYEELKDYIESEISRLEPLAQEEHRIAVEYGKKTDSEWDW